MQWPNPPAACTVAYAFVTALSLGRCKGGVRRYVQGWCMSCTAAVGGGNGGSELPQDGHRWHRAPDHGGARPLNEAGLPGVDSAQGASPCREPAGRCITSLR